MSGIDFRKKHPFLCISFALSITCPLSLVINEVCQTYEISKNHQIFKFFSTTHAQKAYSSRSGTIYGYIFEVINKKLHYMTKVIVKLSIFKLNNKDTRATPIYVILVSLLLTFNKLISWFYLKFWTCIYLVWEFTYNPMFHYSHCRCISDGILWILPTA